jgi:hypothetical protein
MHSTSLLGLLKEFRGQNYAFGRRPNFLKCELRLQPNVKNTASVIHWSLEQFFLTVDQNNFGNKIPLKLKRFWSNFTKLAIMYFMS